MTQPQSIGWQPLGNGAYLHLGKPEEEEVVITVVGVPEVGMAGMNVLLVGVKLIFLNGGEMSTQKLKDAIRAAKSHPKGGHQ